MPLAALDLGPLAKHLAYGLAKPPTAVDDAENSFFEAEPPIQETPKHLLDRFGPLCGRLRKTQDLLVALFGHAHADDHLLTGHVLPMG